MSEHVLISRKWKNPAITVLVGIQPDGEDGISIKANLGDFIQALVMEMGNPTLLFTQAQLEAKIKEAAGKVLEGMKKETERAM